LKTYGSTRSPLRGDAPAATIYLEILHNSGILERCFEVADTDRA